MTRLAQEFTTWCTEEGGNLTYGSDIHKTVPTCEFDNKDIEYDDWIDNSDIPQERIDDWTEHVFSGRSGDDWAYKGVPESFDPEHVKDRIDVDSAIEILKENQDDLVLEDSEIEDLIVASYMSGMDLYGENSSGLGHGAKIVGDSDIYWLDSQTYQDHVDKDLENGISEDWAGAVTAWSYLFGIGEGGDIYPVGVADDITEVGDEFDDKDIVGVGTYIAGEGSIIYGKDNPPENISDLSGKINNQYTRKY